MFLLAKDILSSTKLSINEDNNFQLLKLNNQIKKQLLTTIEPENDETKIPSEKNQNLMEKLRNNQDLEINNKNVTKNQLTQLEIINPYLNYHGNYKNYVNKTLKSIVQIKSIIQGDEYNRILNSQKIVLGNQKNENGKIKKKPWY